MRHRHAVSVVVLLLVSVPADRAAGEVVLVNEWGAQGGAGIAKIDPATDQIVGRIAVAGSPRHFIADNARRIAYVSLHDSDQVAAVMPDTLDVAVLDIPGLGRAPIGIGLTPDGTRLLVATSGTDGVFSADDRLDVVALDHATWPPTPSLITSIFTGREPVLPVVDHTGRFAVVTVRNEPAILGIDLATYEVIWRAPNLPVGAEPEGAAAHPYADLVYVTLHGRNTLEVVRVDPFGITKHVPVTNPGGGVPNPSAVTITPNGQRAYVSGQSCNKVFLFEAGDPWNPVQTTTALPVGPQPHNIAWLPGDRAYVANTNNNQRYGSLSVLHDCSATPTVSGPILTDLAGPLSFATFEPLPTPVLDRLDCPYGVAGAPLTLRGGPFGVYQGTSGVTVNGLDAPATAWGDAAIVVTLPAGVTSGPVVARVRGTPSNALAFAAGEPPLAAVTNLRVALAGGELALSWDPVLATVCGGSAAAAQYRVWRGADPRQVDESIGTSTAESFTTAGGDAAPTTSYFYLVRAEDAAGNPGE